MKVTLEIDSKRLNGPRPSRAELADALARNIVGMRFTVDVTRKTAPESTEFAGSGHLVKSVVADV